MTGREMTFDTHTVTLSNLDKLLFPDERITKQELIGHYDRVAGMMLPHLTGRPLTLERFPEGIKGESFIQKQAPAYFPDWIHKVEIPLKEGGANTQITCDNKETLIYLANQVCVPHVWLSRADKPEYPDRMIFDLAPPDTNFEPVRYSALILREFLREAGLESFAMTTGSRGIHVAVPLDRGADFDTVRTFARDMAEVLVRLEPDLFTNAPALEEREGRMYIDTNRNAYGQTSVAPYSVRALPGAPVATPVEWSDLRERGLHAQTFTLRNIFSVLNERGDPWHGISEKAYSLERPQRRLKRM